MKRRLVLAGVPVDVITAYDEYYPYFSPYLEKNGGTTRDIPPCPINDRDIPSVRIPPQRLRKAASIYQPGEPEYYVEYMELCPAVSRQLSDVIDKALAFDYHDRYRRMLDFLDALEQVVRPEDYDIDLGALMPKSKASKQAEIHVETSDDSEKMCQVEEQNMPEPKGLAAFFHPKKRRLAYLELTMRKSGGHISRRRWIIEPNRTVKVGRLATSDVMMPADNQISRNHCEVFYNEPKREFIVRDLSKYGTYLADGKPMEKEKSYTLKDGDIFCVVSPEYTFKVVIET